MTDPGAALEKRVALAMVKLLRPASAFGNDFTSIDVDDHDVDFEELARVAIDALAQWQPIETAPKDGWILLTGGTLDDQRHEEEDFGKHPVVAKWVLEPMVGWLVADFDDGYGLGVYYEGPTHWMLIPPSPAEMVVAHDGS